MAENSGRISVEAGLPFDYILQTPDSEPRELILLLHGYGESGAGIFGKLQAQLPEESAIVAPNGPFAFAERAEEKYRMAYSWYFYNFQTDEYVIDMKTALQFLRAGIEKLGYGKLPLRIVGFSQGDTWRRFSGRVSVKRGR